MKKLQDQTYDISNRNKLIAELSYKFVTYIIIGINVLFIAPYVFRTIGCERATFHTEVWIELENVTLCRPSIRKENDTLSIQFSIFTSNFYTEVKSKTWKNQKVLQLENCLKIRIIFQLQYGIKSQIQI